MTKAELLRQILRAAYNPNPPDLQTKYLYDFLNKKGPDAGASTKVFYAAYVFFEKLRLAEGKSKSKHRLEMEARWGEEGMRRERGGRRVTCHQDERPVVDQYGRMRIVQK